MDLIEEKIKSLLDNNIGDYTRLYEMLDRHRSEKELYDSDIDYLEKISPTTSEPEIIEESVIDEPIKEKPINLDELRKSQSKTKSNIDTITTRNMSNVYHSYAVSYNTSYRGEIKIHDNSCHHVIRSSQRGSVKWKYAKSLKEALRIANNLSTQFGDYKFPRCCLYSGASYFECNDCERYSDDYDNTHKQHSRKGRLAGIFLIVIPILAALFGISPMYGIQIFLLIAGIIILAVENSIAPTVCSNCLSKNYNRWTLRV